MASLPKLSPEQLAFFREEVRTQPSPSVSPNPTPLYRFLLQGYVTVPRLVGEPQLSVWREQAWEKIGASPSDRSTWPPAPPGGGQLPNIMGVEPSLGAVPEIASVVEQLGGGAFEGGGSMLKAIFPAEFPLPDGATEWHRPNGQHIDGVSQPTPSPPDPTAHGPADKPQG